MVDEALSAVTIGSSYFGFALLALCQKSHRAAVSPRAARPVPPAPSERRRLVLGSGASLALGFVSSLLAEGPSFGSISWVLSLGVAALGLMFTLTYRPHWLRPIQRAFAHTERGA
jgi:hypothetical protein